MIMMIMNHQNELNTISETGIFLVTIMVLGQPNHNLIYRANVMYLLTQNAC